MSGNVQMDYPLPITSPVRLILIAFIAPLGTSYTRELNSAAQQVSILTMCIFEVNKNFSRFMGYIIKILTGYHSISDHNLKTGYPYLFKISEKSELQ